MSTDLVASLAFETYADTLVRRSFSPDVLVQHLLHSPRIDRVLVADPWRSRLGALRRGRVQPALSGGRAVHVRPLRLRRRDPSRPAALDAAADRYLSVLQAAANRAGMERPVLLATHPVVAGRARAQDWAHIAYYGWDDWAAHPDFAVWHEAYLLAYERMRANGVRVVGVTQRIVDRIGSPAPSLAVPNGLHADEWRSPVAPPAWFAKTAPPRLLYTGTIDSRLDVTVIAALSTAFPEATIVIAGTHGDAGVVQTLRDLPNVQVHEWQTRPATRGLVFGCDVALIPHVTSDLTLAMSPLKLYEYLAAGRPVVGSDLPPVRQVPGVLLASRPEQFVSQVRVALDRGPAPEPERLRFIEENSWNRRLEQLLDVVL